LSSSLTSILIVDDEPTLRGVLQKGLSVSGFRAEEARSAEQALAAIRQRHFDLVLLDFGMPGLSGVEACREISKFAPQTGIVMMSVHDEVNVLVDTLAAGADDYVTKPFAFRELVARLRAVHRRVQRPHAPNRATFPEGAVDIEPSQPVVDGTGELIPWLQERSR
jgi:two-component system, OmpR family, KDP operon response regulator KdpE